MTYALNVAVYVSSTSMKCGNEKYGVPSSAQERSSCKDATSIGRKEKIPLAGKAGFCFFKDSTSDGLGRRWPSADST